MSEHEEEVVARVMRTVRSAYDNLQALRASHSSNIPSSLSNVDKTLDKIYGKINLLMGSTEALSIFCGCTVNVRSNSVEILLSRAIVDDMEATANYLRNMTGVGLASLSGGSHEQNCQRIQQMVDRYETIVSTVLNKCTECVHDEPTSCVYLVDPSSRSRLNLLTAQGRETQETVEGISRRQAEQQEAELAELRASELFSTPVYGDSVLNHVKGSMTDSGLSRLPTLMRVSHPQGV
jgi:hypothetical protein